MPEQQFENYNKWKYSIYTLIIFVIVINPYAYQMTNVLFRYVNVFTCNQYKCPTLSGLIIHSILFLFLIRGIMEIKHI